MVTEMSQAAETCQMSQMDRKRPLESETPPAPTMATAATQTEHVAEVKRPRPSQETPALPTNNGWGDLFKNRETFVEMHLC